MIIDIKFNENKFESRRETHTKYTHLRSFVASPAKASAVNAVRATREMASDGLGTGARAATGSREGEDVVGARAADGARTREEEDMTGTRAGTRVGEDVDVAGATPRDMAATRGRDTTGGGRDEVGGGARVEALEEDGVDFDARRSFRV